LTTTFRDLGLPGGLTDLLDELGFTSPFDIQAAAIPDALDGRDIAARAPTGSGKTLAFGLPLLVRVEDARPRRPLGLVLAPTRELAEQIRRELEPIAAAGGRRVAAVYGGVGYGPQRRALSRGVEVLVACPGRLEDLIEQGDVLLSDVEAVVVDEADRMSDMGFLPAVKRLLDQTPQGRQTLLFSATLDGDVGELVRTYQEDPARHAVGSVEPDVDEMRHLFWRLDPQHRVEVASNLIQAAGQTIVFCRTRRGADRVARQLERTGATAAAIHGSRSQAQRTRALQSFADGKVEALVATDVAARGIHVEGVACVLHFDPPVDDKTYIHRSGRTARAGAEGVVVSFLSHAEIREAGRLSRRLRLDVDLSTPAPASLQGALERLRAAPSESFADPELGTPNLGQLEAPRRNGGARRAPQYATGRQNQGATQRSKGNRRTRSAPPEARVTRTTDPQAPRDDRSGQRATDDNRPSRDRRRTNSRGDSDSAGRGSGGDSSGTGRRRRRGQAVRSGGSARRPRPTRTRGAVAGGRP
jgi:superfamily II DNA/RNA helicase